MKSVHKTSDPSAPNVSFGTQETVEHNVCRYCRCRGGECLIPEGQCGFRPCFWLDKDHTVCAGSACAFKWQQGEKGRRAVEIISILNASSGIYTRIARRLGATPSVIRRVALGKATSARISAALVEECTRIDRLLQSKPQTHAPVNGKDYSSPKPRIVLRCMNTVTFENVGLTLATADGYDGAIEIGRPHVEATA